MRYGQFSFLEWLNASQELTGLSLDQKSPLLRFLTPWNVSDFVSWWGFDPQDPKKCNFVSANNYKKLHSFNCNDTEQNWFVRDNDLENDGKGLFPTTNRYYEDFDVLLDYNKAAFYNNNVDLRDCYQVPIWDLTDQVKSLLSANKDFFGLWNYMVGNPSTDPIVKVDKAFSQWNHLKIVMIDLKSSIWFNNQGMVKEVGSEFYFDCKYPKPAKDLIEFQMHSGDIFWLNLFIREIGNGSSNQISNEIDLNEVIKDIDTSSGSGNDRKKISSICEILSAQYFN